MERLPWAAKPASGSWRLHFDDRLFSSCPVTSHIMSRIAAVNDPARVEVEGAGEAADDEPTRTSKRVGFKEPLIKSFLPI